MLNRMRSPHSTRAGTVAVTAALLVGTMSTRMPQAQTPATSTFLVFFRSQPVGNEQVAVERSADGWTITGSGRIGPPFDLVIRSLQARYDADWKPVELTLDASLRGQAAAIRTVVNGTTADTETTPFGGAAVRKSDQIDARAVLLPNPFIAPYEALAAKLRTADPGRPFLCINRGKARSASRLAIRRPNKSRPSIARSRHAARTRSFVPNVPPLELEIWGDEQGRLLRVSIPIQSLEFAREDVAWCPPGSSRCRGRTMRTSAFPPMAFRWRERFPSLRMSAAGCRRSFWLGSRPNRSRRSGVRHPDLRSDR